MAGHVTIAGTQQNSVRTETAGEWTNTLDLEVVSGCDVAVDVSGAATLTVEVSATSEFSGEQFDVTVNYSGADEVIEQFGFAHRYVRAKVDANLTALEIVGRGS